MDSNAVGPESALTKPTPEQEEQAEQLLRQYMVQLRRGATSIADKLLAEAVSIAPGSAGVILAQAEALVERKQTRAAASLLKKGLALYPAHPKLEDLYGELVLRIAGVADMRAPSEFGAMAQGGKAPIFLAAILPGTGHMALGEWRAGLAYMIIVIVCAVWGTLMPAGGTVFIPIVAGFVAWVVNIADVAARSKKAPAVTHDRPIPPSDQSFEL